VTQMQKIRKFEAAWTRYMEALRKRDAEIDQNPRKARSQRTLGTRAMRAAYGNLRAVCKAVGEPMPCGWT
jgi:hypothetical protein